MARSLGGNGIIPYLADVAGQAYGRQDAAQEGDGIGGEAFEGGGVDNHNGSW
jgi:hypothetical protein